MKYMIIRNSRSSGSPGEMFGKMLKSHMYINYTGSGAAELIKREHPIFVSLKLKELKEPVNGDEDMMAMLSSIDANTRLRVSIIDSETIKDYFGSVFQKKNYNLPGTKS